MARRLADRQLLARRYRLVPRILNLRCDAAAGGPAADCSGDPSLSSLKQKLLRKLKRAKKIAKKKVVQVVKQLKKKKKTGSATFGRKNFFKCFFDALDT